MRGPGRQPKSLTPRVAAIAPLPVEEGLYYRTHHKDAPFSREHASTRNIGEPPSPGMAKYWEPKPGYSSFWNPHHLHQYHEEMGWDGPQEMKGRRVLAFRGTPVGSGADGEPAVMPHSDKPEASMAWGTFRKRLEVTPEPATRWDDHTWGEGPHGQMVDDGYRTIGVSNPRTAARYAPSSGIFGPTTGLDPRLFDEDSRLRPAVRGAVMEKLDRCLRVDSGLAGSDWQDWLHVYLLGGSASEWAGTRPNDEAADLDVIVLLDLPAAQGHSSFTGMTKDEAVAALNRAFRLRFNKSSWQPDFGGKWDVTAYCNPAASIADIRPYAAYDLTDGRWEVRPPHLPEHSIRDFDPAVVAHARAVLAEARAVLRMPEPLRTREARDLWDHVHAHRCVAFSPEGTGWDDVANIDEKFTAYAPGNVLGRVRDLAMARTASAGDSGYLRNPYHGNPEFGGNQEWSHTWFHGTTGHEAPAFGEAKPGSDAGKRPGSSWEQPNKYLGVHVTPLRSVAQKFAHGVYASNIGSGSPGVPSAIVHMRLHMSSPKHFPTERGMDLDIARYASEHHPGWHDDKLNGSLGWNYSDQKGTHRDWHAPAEGKDAERLGNQAQRVLQHHPRLPEIIRGYVSHLHQSGHDGITYGNEVEGPGEWTGKARHISAIATHPSQIEVTHVEHIAPPNFGRPDDPPPEPHQITHSASEAASEPEDMLGRVAAFHAAHGGEMPEPHDAHEPRTASAGVKTAAWQPDTSGSQEHGIYLRFGHWPDDERSANHVTGDREHGVSAYELGRDGEPADPDPHMERGHRHDEYCDEDCNADWDNDDYGNDTAEELRDRVQKAERNRRRGDDRPGETGHLVTGEMIGLGHDAEPLLRNVKRVGDWIDHRHLLIPGAQPHRLARDPSDEDYEQPKLPRRTAAAEDYRYEHLQPESGNVHWVNAYHPDGRRVGDMTWHAHGDHHVTWIAVYDKDDRRKGIATGMWNKAREVDPNVSHNTSEDGQTEAGRSWAQTTAVSAQRTAASDDDEDADRYVTCGRGETHWGSAGAAGLLIRHKGDDGKYRYLLQHRSPYVQHGGTWSTPGGALHHGESPEEGATREATEEFGDLPGDLVHHHTFTDDHDGWAYHTVVTDSPRRFSPGGEDDGDWESQGHGWFTPQEIRDLPLHPGFAASWDKVRKSGAVKKQAAIDPDSRIVRSPAETGWGDDEWAAARREPWHAASRLAQQQVRMDHPRLSRPFPTQHEDGDEMVGHMLRYVGYQGDVEGAFVARHPNPDARTSNPSWLNGRPGVALHPDRWDWGTVAHECAHHAVMHDHAASPNEYQPDEQVHGPEWAGHYAQGLNRLSKNAGDEFLEHHRFYRDMIGEGLQRKRPSDLDDADRRRRTAAAADDRPDGIRMVAPEEYRKYAFPDYPAKTLPALARHLRKNRPEYYDKLRADIESNGISTPLMVRFPGIEGHPVRKPQVMDGHHRGAIASELGIPVPVGDYDNSEHHDTAMKAGQAWFRDNYDLKAGIEREASAQGGPWYHGSEHSFRPGDFVEPGHPSPHRGGTDDHVYFTSDPGEAAVFARPRRGGHVYQVEPQGHYEGDPEDYERRINYQSEHPLRVVRRVPPPWKREAVAEPGYSVPQMPPRQQAAHYQGDFMKRRQDLLDVAKSPEPGTVVWRSERRPKGEDPHPPSVGIHWTVNPDQVIHFADTPTHHTVVYQGRIEDPADQAIPRSHPMWFGKHRSMDAEAEIRLRPGSHVHLEGTWVPQHPSATKREDGSLDQRGPLVPLRPERMTPGHWGWHPHGADVPVRHAGRGPSDYSEFGIEREASSPLRYFHVAPRSARASIASNGLLPDRELNPDDYGHLAPGEPAGDADAVWFHGLHERPPHDDAWELTHPHLYDMEEDSNYESGATNPFYRIDGRVELRHLRLADELQREAVKGYDLSPRSGMIYLDLPPDLIKKVRSGVDDHHITLVYLGKDVSDEAFEQACRRAKEAAADCPPLEGVLRGVDSFPPSDSSGQKTPVFVPAHVPGISRLREALEDLSASEHDDWRPHVTLGYYGEGEALPEPQPPVRVSFTRLHVKRGDEVKSYPLGGIRVEAAIPQKLYHGTLRDLRRGEMIYPGNPANDQLGEFGADGTREHVYAASTPGWAHYHAEEIASEQAEPGAPRQKPRVYQVISTGPVEPDPELQESGEEVWAYRSRHPFRVVREIDMSRHDANS